MSELITVKEAKCLWDKNFPECLISRQTIVNWCRKYSIGKKVSPLQTSKFIIDKKGFINLIKKYK